EADHDHHHADRAHDAPDQERQVAPLVVAGDQHGDDEGIDARNRGRLGRREDARDDAAHDYEDRAEAPERLDHDLERTPHRDDFAPRVAALARDDEDEDHQRQAEQHA